MLKRNQKMNTKTMVIGLIIGLLFYLLPMCIWLIFANLTWNHDVAMKLVIFTEVFISILGLLCFVLSFSINLTLRNIFSVACMFYICLAWILFFPSFGLVHFYGDFGYGIAILFIINPIYIFAIPGCIITQKRNRALIPIPD